ncbi:MAG: cytochrome c oxidase accessory protein CcoG, partial [Capnocytophaga sp.]|nr:cytochrome c oxidase accessory protein CcoG [Capnocytophaga sp.]
IVGNPDIHLGKQGLVSGTLFIKMHQAFVTERKLKLKIEVYSGENRIESTTTTFSGPITF